MSFRPSAETLVFELISRLGRRTGGNRVIALCYHRILPGDLASGEFDRFTVFQRDFGTHLREIKRAGFEIIGPHQVAGHDGNGALITFDDNLSSHLNHALPVLREYQATATFFLNPDQLNRDGQMVDQDVETLLAAGMTVGAHNAEHKIVSEMDPEAFRRAVTRCEDFLDRYQMGRWWAYPGGYPGSFSSSQDAYLRERGFLRFSTLEGDCTDDPQGVQSRYVLRTNSTLSYLRAILAGRLRLVAKLKQRRYAEAVRAAEQRHR